MTDDGLSRLRQGRDHPVFAASARKTPTGRHSRSRCSTSAASIDEPPTYRIARRAPGHDRARARPARQPHLLPGGAADDVRADGQAAGARRGSSARRDPPPFARLIVEKPIGRDLGSARDDQRRDRGGVRRAPDLPDRSLSREGNGPEHSRAPVRQQHLRAAVQPEVHRSRPDHRRGGRRGRHPRRLLRAGGRAARHGAEPHPAAGGAGRDGAAAIARRRRRARRKAGSAAVAAADRRRGGRRRRRSGRSTPPASTLGAPVPGYLQEEGVDPRTRAPKRSWRCRCSSTTGAGPACRSSCAPASGCRSARARFPST